MLGNIFISLNIPIITLHSENGILSFFPIIHPMKELSIIISFKQPIRVGSSVPITFLFFKEFI